MTMEGLRVGIALIFAGLGLLIAYEDLRTHKIRNVRILAGLGICAVGYSALLGIHLWSGAGVPPGYFGRAAVHAALSLIIGLVFWQNDIWPAGDAKLFILAAVALPLIDLTPPRFPHALFLVLLINIFLPCMALTLVYIVAGYLGKWAAGTTDPIWLARQIFESLRGKAGGLKGVELKVLVGVLALFTAGTYLRFALMKVSLYWTTFHALFYLVLYLYWSEVTAVLERVAGSALIFLFVAYVAVGSAAFPSLLAAHLKHALKMYAGFGGFFMLLRMALLQGTEALDGRQVDAADVQAGMVPLDMKLDPRFDWEGFGPLSRDGLSEAQAAQLRAWAAGVALEQRSILVSKDSRAFGGWIVAGAVLTLLIRTDILHIGKALAGGKVG